MTALEILDRAIEIKKQRPHAQRVFLGEDGGVCTAASVMIAAGVNPNVYGFADVHRLLSPGDHLALKTAEEALNQELNARSFIGGICTFNNSHSKDEVVEMMERARAFV